MVAIPARGTTYFVSFTHGNDMYDGRTAASPWRTLGRVNREPLWPGDSVQLRRGDLWRETLRPPTSGSSDAPITFGAYGRGPRPVITGSDVVAESAWKKAGADIYFVDGLANKPASTWQGKRRLKEVASATQLAHDLEWCWGAGQLYVRSSSGAPSGIEIQVREIAIDNNEQSHLVYEALDLQRAREGLRLYAWSRTVEDITLQDSLVATEPGQDHGMVSAGVYASVHTGRLSGIIIRRNRIVPYPQGLRHWGVYFVRGISGFRIEGNSFEPAGEDAICIWHSSGGVIARNRGHRNGENTIDVKDSQDIRISENVAENDSEYNVVVHSVDNYDLTHHIVLERNRCLGGGSGGHLTAGIALLFVRDVHVLGNTIEYPYREGIFVHDAHVHSRNEVSGNMFRMPARNSGLSVFLQESPGTLVGQNRPLAP